MTGGGAGQHERRTAQSIGNVTHPFGPGSHGEGFDDEGVARKMLHKEVGENISHDAKKKKKKKKKKKRKTTLSDFSPLLQIHLKRVRRYMKNRPKTKKNGIIIVGKFLTKSLKRKNSISRETNSTNLSSQIYWSICYTRIV